MITLWALRALYRALRDCARATGRALAALRRHIARRFSSQKDLSAFDLSETLGSRRPNWSRGVHLETKPLNREQPMFSPTRSRYARVAAADSTESDEVEEE